MPRLVIVLVSPRRPDLDELRANRWSGSDASPVVGLGIAHAPPEAETLHHPFEVVMSPKVNEQSQSPSFQSDEEQWFVDHRRERKRPLRTSPTTPPPPIGDEVADRWFR
jgi:hypothetical protein